MDLIGSNGLVSNINKGLVSIKINSLVEWRNTSRIDNITSGEVLSIGYTGDTQEMFISKVDQLEIEYVNIKVHRGNKYGILKVSKDNIDIILDTIYDSVYVYGSVMYSGENEKDYKVYIYKDSSIEDCSGYTVKEAIQVCNLMLYPVYKKKKELCYFEVRDCNGSSVMDNKVICVRYKREIKQLLKELREISDGEDTGRLNNFIDDITSELSDQLLG